LAKPKFSFCETERDHIITFEIPSGVTTPQEFAEAMAECAGLFMGGEKGVIIDGRGPIWAYAMIVHQAHPSAYVATRDPRLGAVVVETHTTSVKTGDVLPFPK
jgi:CRISPR-associated protein Csx3